MALEIIRPVRPGILIGLFGLLFGIGWAFYLVLGHESIHMSMVQKIEQRVGQKATMTAPSAEALKANVHIHKDKSLHQHGPVEVTAQTEEPAHHPAVTGGHEHDNPMMALAHARLVRGHLHAMGLGLAAILISIVLALTSAPRIIKTLASISIGLGGFIYPLAWIAMGYRTPLFGAEAAEASVVTIAGPGVLLVLAGIITAIIFLTKDAFSNR